MNRLETPGAVRQRAARIRLAVFDVDGVLTDGRLLIDADGRIVPVMGEAAVEQSVRLILSTAMGERIMRPEFGCGLHGRIFDPGTTESTGQLIGESVGAAVSTAFMTLVFSFAMASLSATRRGFFSLPMAYFRFAFLSAA